MHLLSSSYLIRRADVVQGLEDPARLNKYIDKFKTRIKTETNNTVTVHETLDNKDVSYASEFKTAEGSSQS